MRIAFKPAGLEAVGCYRVIFPMRELKEQYGWEIEPFSLYERQLADGRTGRVFSTKSLPNDAELIVLQIEMNLAALDQIDEWQKEGRTVVLELDDDYSRLAQSNPAWYSSHPDPRIRAAWTRKDLDPQLEFTSFVANRDNIWEIARAVDAITVSTPALYEHCRKYNDQVYVLPNMLDWEMWRDVKPQYEIERERPRFGYMGVARWHQEDVNQLRGVLAPLLRKYPELEFVAAGDASIHDLLEIPESQRVSYDACSFGEHVEITATMDIGLVPLAPGIFNEAKSALKGMEYNACGIAFIASPTEPYALWQRQSGGGTLAKRGHDWALQIELLLKDPLRRRELARSGRKVVETMTIQRHARLWKETYETIIQEAGRARRAGSAGKSALAR